MELERWMENMEARIRRCEDVSGESMAIADETRKECRELKERVCDLESRVDRLDGKMDTLLDSTSQIKAMLTENGRDSKSARRNAKGWGFISVLVTIVSNVLKFLFIV